MILRRLRGISGGHGEMRSLFDAQVVALAIIVLALFGSFVLIAGSEKPQETVAQVRYGVATTLVSIVDLPSTIVSYLELITTVGQAGAAAKPGGLQDALKRAGQAGMPGGPNAAAAAGGNGFGPLGGLPQFPRGPTVAGGGGPPRPVQGCPTGPTDPRLNQPGQPPAVGRVCFNKCGGAIKTCKEKETCSWKGGAPTCSCDQRATKCKSKSEVVRVCDNSHVRTCQANTEVCEDKGDGNARCRRLGKKCNANNDGTIDEKTNEEIKCGEKQQCVGDPGAATCQDCGFTACNSDGGDAKIRYCDRRADKKKFPDDKQFCVPVNINECRGADGSATCVCKAALKEKRAFCSQDGANVAGFGKFILNDCEPKETIVTCEKKKEIQMLCDGNDNVKKCKCPPPHDQPFDCFGTKVLDECDQEKENCAVRGPDWTCKKLNPGAKCDCPEGAAKKYCSVDGKTEQTPGTMIIDGCGVKIQDCAETKECVNVPVAGPTCLCKRELREKRVCSKDAAKSKVLDGCNSLITECNNGGPPIEDEEEGSSPPSGGTTQYKICVDDDGDNGPNPAACKPLPPTCTPTKTCADYPKEWGALPNGCPAGTASPPGTTITPPCECPPYYKKDDPTKQSGKCVCEDDSGVSCSGDGTQVFNMCDEVVKTCIGQNKCGPIGNGKVDCKPCSDADFNNAAKWTCVGGNKWVNSVCGTETPCLLGSCTGQTYPTCAMDYPGGTSGGTGCTVSSNNCANYPCGCPSGTPNCGQDNCGNAVACPGCTSGKQCHADGKSCCTKKYGPSDCASNQCGTIPDGDGCGGPLECPASCPQASDECGTDHKCVCRAANKAKRLCMFSSPPQQILDDCYPPQIVETCTAAKPWCDPASTTCVGCTKNEQCPQNNYCDSSTKTCKCVSGVTCQGNMVATLCGEKVSDCVGCYEYEPNHFSCEPRCGNNLLDTWAGETCDHTVQQCALCDSTGGTTGGWDPGTPGAATWFSTRPVPGSTFSLLWDIVSPFFNFFGTNLGRSIASPCGSNQKFCNACQWDSSECGINTGGTTTPPTCTVSSNNCASYPCGGSGEDNCGNSVTCPNTCSSGQICYNNQCCTQKYASDACGSKECGTASDGCGGTVQCGAYSGGCPSGRTCNAGMCEGCGNGRKEGTEECDDGNTINTDACTSTCKNAKCGDTFKQSTEECDDGNTINTDACTSTCKNAKCGDAIVRIATEQCDDGNTINTDTCTSTCQNARCGDGIVRAGGEQCDGGSQACTTTTGYSGTQSCTSSCAWNACSSTQYCGDAVKNGVEACDWAASTSQCQVGYSCSDTCACTYAANSPCGVYGLAHGQQSPGSNQWCCNGQMVYNQNFNDCRIQPGLCFGSCTYNAGSGCPGTASCGPCQGIIVNGVCCPSGSMTISCADGTTKCCTSGQICYCTNPTTTSTTTTTGSTTYYTGGTSTYVASAVPTGAAAQQASLEVVTGLAVAEPVISLLVGQTFVSSKAIIMCEHDSAVPDPSKALVLLMRGDSATVPEGTVVCRAGSGGIGSVGQAGIFDIFNIVTVGRAGDTDEPPAEETYDAAAPYTESGSYMQNTFGAPAPTQTQVFTFTNPDTGEESSEESTYYEITEYPPGAPIPAPNPGYSVIILRSDPSDPRFCYYIMWPWIIYTNPSAWGHDALSFSADVMTTDTNVWDEPYNVPDGYAMCFDSQTISWESVLCGGENGDQPFNSDTGLYDPPCPYGCDKESGDCNPPPTGDLCGTPNAVCSPGQSRGACTAAKRSALGTEYKYPGTDKCNEYCDAFECVTDLSCPDGKKNGDELCDGSDFGGKDCNSETGGQLKNGKLTCTDCKIFSDTCVGQATCGNNVAEYDELCDGADLKGQSCVYQGYDGGDLKCNMEGLAACKGYQQGNDPFTGLPYPKDCHKCGNGILEPGERCDRSYSQYKDKTCAQAGFAGGDQAACDFQCNWHCGESTSGKCYVHADCPQSPSPQLCDAGDCRPKKYCGDKIIQNPNDDKVAEQCDDGNTDPGDGCDNCKTACTDADKAKRKCVIAPGGIDAVGDGCQPPRIYQDCTAGNDFCDPATVSCVECLKNLDCPQSPTQPMECKDKYCVKKSVCLDGTKSFDEACDESDPATKEYGKRCKDFGLQGLNDVKGDVAACLNCKPQCSTSYLPYTYCGDGIIQNPNSFGDAEQCEGNTALPCSDSSGQGTRYCDQNTCKWGACKPVIVVTNIKSCCGNGIIDDRAIHDLGGEQYQCNYEDCDYSASNNPLIGTATCAYMGGLIGEKWYGPLGCYPQGTRSTTGEDLSCRFDLSRCGSCGDGKLQRPDEQCDGKDLGGIDCELLHATYSEYDPYGKGGTLECKSDCKFDPTYCSYCGNGLLDKDKGETCDGNDFDGATCDSVMNDGKHYDGVLKCTTGPGGPGPCKIDKSGCKEVAAPTQPDCASFTTTCGGAEKADGAYAGKSVFDGDVKYTYFDARCPAKTDGCAGNGCKRVSSTEATCCIVQATGWQCDSTKNSRYMLGLCGVRVSEESCGSDKECKGGECTSKLCAKDADCSSGQVCKSDGSCCTRQVIDTISFCQQNLPQGVQCGTASGTDNCGKSVTVECGCPGDKPCISGSCTMPVSEVKCGNNKKEGSEKCDGTDLAGQTCSVLTEGKKPFGTPSCYGASADAAARCTFNTEGCKECEKNSDCPTGKVCTPGGCTEGPTYGETYCGDGTIQPQNGEGGTEQCEMPDKVGDMTCKKHKPNMYTGGTLLCKRDGKNCVFDDSRCEYETPPATQQCGNNKKETSESCDGTDLDGKTCGGVTIGLNPSLPKGTLACYPQGNAKECQFNVEGCKQCEIDSDCSFNERCVNYRCAKKTYCGDGIIQDKNDEGGTENCEIDLFKGVVLNGYDCSTVDPKFTGGKLNCKRVAANCVFDTSGCTSDATTCGNNKREDPEQCDGTDFGSATCASATGNTLRFGFLQCVPKGGAGGKSGCSFDTSMCKQCEKDPDCPQSPVRQQCFMGKCEKKTYCGDNVRQNINDDQEQEKCDGADLDSKTCEDFIKGSRGTLACTSSCDFDTSGCKKKCGDGVIQNPNDDKVAEDCETKDGAPVFTDPSYAACYSHANPPNTKGSAGSVGCSSCKYDFSACKPDPKKDCDKYRFVCKNKDGSTTPSSSGQYAGKNIFVPSKEPGGSEKTWDSPAVWRIPLYPDCPKKPADGVYYDYCAFGCVQKSADEASCCSAPPAPSCKKGTKTRIIPLYCGQVKEEQCKNACKGGVCVNLPDSISFSDSFNPTDFTTSTEPDGSTTITFTGTDGSTTTITTKPGTSITISSGSDVTITSTASDEEQRRWAEGVVAYKKAFARDLGVWVRATADAARIKASEEGAAREAARKAAIGEYQKRIDALKQQISSASGDEKARLQDELKGLQTNKALLESRTDDFDAVANNLKTDLLKHYTSGFDGGDATPLFDSYLRQLGLRPPAIEDQNRGELKAQMGALESMAKSFGKKVGEEKASTPDFESFTKLVNAITDYIRTAYGPGGSRRPYADGVDNFIGRNGGVTKATIKKGGRSIDIKHVPSIRDEQNPSGKPPTIGGTIIQQTPSTGPSPDFSTIDIHIRSGPQDIHRDYQVGTSINVDTKPYDGKPDYGYQGEFSRKVKWNMESTSNGCYKLRATLSLHELLERLPYENKLAALLNQDTIRQQIEKHPIEIIVESCAGKLSIDFKFPDFESTGFADLISGGLKKAFMDMFRSNADSFLDVLDDLPGLKSGMKQQLKDKFAATLKALLGTDVKRLTSLDSIHLEMTDMPPSSPGGVPTEMQVQVTVSGKTDSGIATSFTGTGVANPKLPPTGGDITSAALAYIEALMKGYLAPQSQTPQTGTMARDIFNFLGLWYGWMYNGGLSPGDAIEKIVPPAGKPQETVSPSVGDVNAKVTKPAESDWGGLTWKTRPEFGASVSVQLTGPDGTSILPTPFEVKIESSQKSAKITIKIPSDGKGGDSIRRALKHALETGDLSLLDKIFDGVAGGMGAEKAQWFKNALKDAVDALRKNGGLSNLDSMSELSLRLSENSDKGMDVALDIVGKGSDGKDVSASSGTVKEELGAKWPTTGWASGAWDYLTSDNPMIKIYKEGSSAGRWAPGFDPSADTPTRMLNTLMGFIEGLLGNRNNVKPYAPGDLPGIFKGEKPAAPTSNVAPQKTSFNDGSVGIKGSSALASFRTSTDTSQYVGLSLPEGQTATLTKEVTLASPITDDLYIGTPTTLEFNVKTQGGVPQVTPSESTVQTLADVTSTDSFLVTDKDTSFAVSGSGKLPGVGPLAAPPAQVTFLMLATYGLAVQTAAVMSPTYLVPASDVYRKDEAASFGPKDLASEYKLVQVQAQRKPSTNPCADKLKLAALKYAEYHKKIIGPLLQQAMEQAKALRDPNSPKSAFDAAVDAFAKGQSGFDKAIEATQRFLNENGGTSSPIAPQLSAQLAELQAAKAGAIMPEDPGLTAGFFHVPEADPETEPLMYKTRMEYDEAKGDFVEKVKEWSPDGVNFMPTSQTTVKGGKYDGKKPTAENQQLISRIEQSGGDMSMLRAERDARLSQGATDKYPVTNSRAGVSESYRRAVKALDEARKRFEEARELAKNMIPECDKYHGELLDEYDRLREAGDPSRESLSPSIHAAGVATQEMRDLLVSSHQSAAMMYSHMGKNDKARESLLKLIDTTGSKVEGYIGLAMIDMAEGDLKEALVSVNKALDYEPGDPQALAMKRVLEAAFTSVVRKAVATERDQLTDEFQGKIGAELSSWWDKVKALGRTGIGKAGLAITDYFSGGYYKSTLSSMSETQRELGYQQFGTLLIEHLLKLSADDIRNAFGPNSGLENLDLKDIEQFTSSDLDTENRLAKVMGLPIDDSNPAVRDQAVRALAEMRRALIAAYSNPDIQSLKDYRGSQLQLETGTGYKDHSIVESSWRDWALNAVNAENVLLMLAPGAKVGGAWSSIGLQYWRGARYIGIGAELSAIQKAPTLAAWLLSGLFRAGQGLVGAEHSAQLAESYGTISKAVTQTMDSTMGSSSVGRLLTAQMGTGLVARSTFGALKFVASEAIESVIGYGVGSLAGGLSPEIGDFVSSFVEASIGSSGVVDDALESLGKASRNSRHFILGEGGKVLGELIDVESDAARQALIDQLRKSAAAKGLSFQDLGSGQIRIGDAHYKLQAPEDRLPTSLAGQNIRGGLAVSVKTPPPAPLNTIDAGKVPPAGADSSLAPLSESNSVRLERAYAYRAGSWRDTATVLRPLSEGGLQVGEGRPVADYVYELTRVGDTVKVKVTRAATHGNTRGVVYEATHSASDFPYVKNGETFRHVLAQHPGADLELHPPVIDVPKPPTSPAPLPEGFSSEAQLAASADATARSKLGKSLDELVNDLGRTSGKSLDDFAKGVDAKMNFLKSNDLESLTDEELIALAEAYRRKLLDAGVAEEKSLMNSQISPEPVSDKGNDFNVARYRSDLSRREGFLDYIRELDNQFSATTKKVFLGTDGIEYTKPAYDLSTIHDGVPNSQQYFINRIMLATEDELMRLRQRIAMGENIEALQQVGTGNIGLYMDLDTAIASAANSVRKGVNFDGSPTQGFEDELRKQFNSVMQDAANRKKVMDLVNDFRKSVDLRESMVLVDVAGRAHTQPFALQKGVEWVGNNWDSLTPVEKALLGNDGSLFKNAKIDRHLGVSSIEHPSNFLQGLDIEGIVSVEGAGDIVEVARSMRIDEGALLDSRKEFLPTPAIDQAQTVLQQLILAQELQFSLITP